MTKFHLLNVVGISLLASSPAGAFDERSVLNAVAASKDCTGYRWRERGPAPRGYMHGMALSYAKNYCDLKRGAPSARTMATPRGPSSRDALTHYGVGLGGSVDRLRATFTIAVGLGMRESSGNPSEGRDRNVLRPTPTNAEAGLFQTSYDSLGRHPRLSALWRAYRASPGSCNRQLFQAGSKPKNAPIVGGGAPAEFQAFNKACPAFAADYAAILLRFNRLHFGPINSRKAEFRPACERMFRRIEVASHC